MNRTTRRYYGAACGAWKCGLCAPVKKAQVVRRMHLGLAHGRAKFLTLTSRPGETFEECCARATARFELLRLIVQRETGHKLAYLGVAERGTHRGRRFHLHFVIRGPWVHQARWSAWAERAGFGRVVDIRAVAGGDVTGYVAKALAGYMTKAANDEAWPRHFRRIRVSRNWSPDWIAYRPATAGEWLYMGMEPAFDPTGWVAGLASQRRQAEETG